MRARAIEEPNAPFELVERPMPEPGPREVRIKVEACGICHSDLLSPPGPFRAFTIPPCPDTRSPAVSTRSAPTSPPGRSGQRVGVGWFGGVCFVCDRCRRGDFITCRNLQVPGIHYDGGYADYMIAPIEALASIPDELDAAAAAPLLCAGITTFNALRNSGARPGDIVAIQGIGGLGHLAVQFAAAWASTPSPSPAARTRRSSRSISARIAISTARRKTPPRSLMALGGAKVILTTVTSGKAMTPLIDGLGIDGTLLVVGASPEPIEVNPFHIHRRSAAACAAGRRAHRSIPRTRCASAR